MSVVIDKNPDWLSDIDNNLFRDSDFVDIFTFFVINSPCSTLSRRRISLYDYGWNTPWRKPFSLRRQLQRASSNYKLLHSADNVDSVEVALEKASLDDENWTNANMESICVYDCEGNQFLSVFYHIRNSLAHGRFNIFQEDEDWIFYMEDARGLRRREKNAGYLEEEHQLLTARMVLRKSTLMNWIELISHGEAPF